MKSRATFFALGAVFIFAFAFSQTAHAAVLPTVSSATIQNATSSTVDIAIAGSNFDRFFDSQDSDADSTDLSHIHYNGNVPTIATISGSTITATFPLSVGTYKSGGAITFAASTLANGTLSHNTSTLSVANGSITDNAKPIVVVSDIDGDALDGSTSSPQTVKITFSEPVTIPTISVDPDGSAQTANDCSDANAATWCFDYSIPSNTTATETITISDADDLASSPNTMDSDDAHQFTVSPYENSLDVVADMVNADATHVELIVPSTGPTLTAFWYSGTTTASGTDLSGITYNGTNPSSATIDTDDNAVDLFFPISIEDPRDGINSWDITTAPNGDLDIAQAIVVASGSIGNDEDFVPEELITDDAAPVLVDAYAQGEGVTSEVRLSLSENDVDTDDGAVSHPNFTVKNATTGQSISVTSGDIGESDDNHIDVHLDTSDPHNYDGPLTFSYNADDDGSQPVDFSGNYMASVSDYPVEEANDGYSPYDGGDGSGDHPFEITSCAGLESINSNSDNYADYYVLQNDIDCSGDTNAAMIANADNPFTGTFNGNGYKITVALTANANEAGLFAYVDGGLVENLWVDGTVDGSTYNDVGGAVGYLHYGTVTKVKSTVAITGTGNYYGGLVGDTYAADINNAYFNGSVSGGSDVGGVAGEFFGGGYYDDYSIGSVSANGDNVGGIVGKIDSGPEVGGDWSAAAVSGDGSDIGGAFGDNVPGGEIGNNWWDIQTSGQTDSVGSDPSTLGVEGINADGTQSDYFKNDNRNPPLGSWNFSSIWEGVTGQYPILRVLVDESAPTTPDQVTDLSANAVSDSEIDLSWSAPADGGSEITGYEIERESPDGGGFSSIVANTESTDITFDDTDLDSDTQYNYRVSAINGVGTGDASDTADATTVSDTPISISSCDDFENIENDLSGNYLLTGDLDCHLRGNAIVVATAAPFTGEFDGGGNTITIALDDPVGDFNDLGLFEATQNASISNLTIAGTVKGVGEIGALTASADDSLFTNDHSAADITLYDNEDEVPVVGGLVGYVEDGSEILNSSESGTITSSGSTTFLGGLAGVLDQSAIGYSYATGNVSTSSTNLGCGVGGLVGCELDESEILQSYATGDVSASYSVGGFVGGEEDSLITDSYATGNISGDNQIGGFAGWTDGGGEITKAYASGSVTGDNGENGGGGEQGGFLGEASDTGINNSFSTGLVSNVVGTSGGFTGEDQGDNSYDNDFYDQIASGQTGCTQSGDVDGCAPVNTSDSPSANYFKGNDSNDPFSTWDFTDAPIWDVVANHLPILDVIDADHVAPSPFDSGDGSSETPYQISTCEQLQDAGSYLSSSFILEHDIDCKATRISNPEDPDYDAALYNSGVGFTHIGDDNNRFTGIFNGNNHVISNLFIDNAADANGVGLFGAIDTGSVIENVGLLYANVTANLGKVGTLVGEAYGSVHDSFARGAVNADGQFAGVMFGVTRGTVSNVYASGTVTASQTYVGGLAGFNAGSITNAYADVSVTANSIVGGLVGRLFTGSSLTNVFAVGSVSGGDSSSSGSIAGEKDGSTTITNAYGSASISGKSSCFPDSDNTGCTDESSRGYFTNPENEPLASFADFETHWQENLDLPTLAWEGPEITSFTPFVGAIDVGADTSLVMTFDRAVSINFGTYLKIIKVADGSTVTTLNVADDADGGGSSTITIPTGVTLDPDTEYAVEIDPATFVDEDETYHNFYGITTPYVWTFTTAASDPGTVGKIKVTVIDIAGTPIAGAAVDIACPAWNNFVALGTSDEDGVVEVDPRTVSSGDCGDSSPISFSSSKDGYIDYEADWVGNYNVNADPENEVDDSTDNQFALKMIPNFNGTGSGRSDDPYIISSCLQLEGIDNDPTAYYKIGNESGTTIDCSGVDFQPIAFDSESGFTGTLDGNDATIENVTINQPDEGEIGLFSYVSSGATIKNLTLSSGSVTGEYDVGSLVGDIDQYATLQNISSDLTISGSDDSDEGGIVGYAELYNSTASTFSHLTYTGSTDIPENQIGGIFGEIDIYDLDTTADIDSPTVSGGSIGSFSSGQSGEVGGIIGELYIDASSDGDPAAGITIANATVSSTIGSGGGDQVGGLIGYLQADSDSGPVAISINNASVASTVSGRSEVGGLIGRSELDDDGGDVNLHINNSSSADDITGSENDIGGLIGRALIFNNEAISLQTKIENSFATGTITGDSNVGGILGGTDWEGPGIYLGDSGATGGLLLQNDYYSTGEIVGNVDDDNASNAGGLVGYMSCQSNNTDNPYGCAISSSYATGNVSGYADVGGLIGEGEGDTSVSDAYATGDVSGPQQIGGLIGYANQNYTNLSVRRTYASGALHVPDLSPQNAGGLIGEFDSNGGAIFADSFTVADLSDVVATENLGRLVGELGSVAPTNLWYSPVNNDGELNCAGDTDDNSFCASESDPTFFQNSSSNGPFSNWDFTSETPVWENHAEDYPTLTGAVETIVDAPTVSITAPDADSTVTTWSPVIDWGTATSCFYSYGETDIDHEVNCANNGSDIPAPTGSDIFDENQVGLNIQGSNSGGTSESVTHIFTYSPEVGADPTVSFISPTPANSSSQSAKNIEVNLSTADSNDGHYAFTDFDHSLLGLWRFENNGNDDTGINNGTWNGTEAYSSGKFGTAGSFDGESSYLDVALSSPVTSSFTVSAWVYLNSITDSAAIVSNDGGQVLQIGGSDRWQFDNVYSADSVAETGVWTHLAAVYNATTNTETLYVNGENMASGGGSITLGQHLNIGRRMDGYYIDGKIDDVTLFNRALGASEVSSLYDARDAQYDHLFSNLSTGNHTVTGYAVDSAGNKIATSTRTITILTASSGGGGGSSSGSAVSYLASPPISTGTTTPIITAPPVNASGAILFLKNLKLNMKTGDVLRLQQFLNQHGYSLAKSGGGSAGHETNLFSMLTKNALIKFQKAHGLSADGIFGPKTRAATNAIISINK